MDAGGDEGTQVQVLDNIGAGLEEEVLVDGELVKERNWGTDVRTPGDTIYKEQRSTSHRYIGT